MAISYMSKARRHKISKVEKVRAVPLVKFTGLERPLEDKGGLLFTAVMRNARNIFPGKAVPVSGHHKNIQVHILLSLGY